MSCSFSKKQVKWTLLTFVILRVFVLVLLDQHTYWTFDEPWNTETAKQVLIKKQFHRIKDSFTPISIANVWLGEEVMPFFPKMDKLTAYRIAGIVLNQAAVPLSYGLAIELGAATFPALIFTAFLSFEPNVLGHTVLASNVDGYIFTCFLLLALVALRWARRPSYLNLSLFGAVLGLAQGVKLTSAYAVPLCILWLGAVTWKRGDRKVMGPLLKNISIFLFFSWFGLCLFYAFNKLGTPFDQIHFVSQQFQYLGQKLSSIPSIIPVDYLQGLDMCLKTDTSPRAVYIRNTFLLHGVWYYFLYVLLLKTPIPILIGSITGWIVAVRRKILGIPHTFLLLFISVMMIYFSFFFNAQIGIRYLFPIYGYLLAGLLWFPWKKATFILAAFWMILSIGYNWPNFIGYYNEFVWTKHHRWWHLGDSNLTWNQEWKDWPRFISQNKLTNDQIGPPTFPISIPFYEDALMVSGVVSNRQQLQVLRDHFSPIDSFWGAQLKYILTPAQVIEQFPPTTFGPSASAPGPCSKTGWIDETGGQVTTDLSFLSLPVGNHLIHSQINIEKRVPVFFQMASKGSSVMQINGQTVITDPHPTPRVAVKNLMMEPGRYDVFISYSKDWPDGFLSVRAYPLDAQSEPPPNSLDFCLPSTIK